MSILVVLIAAMSGVQLGSAGVAKLLPGLPYAGELSTSLGGSRFSNSLVKALGLFELILGSALLLGIREGWTYPAAALLFGLFAVGIEVLLSRGAKGGCGCGSPVSFGTIGHRQAVLAGSYSVALIAAVVLPSPEVIQTDTRLLAVGIAAVASASLALLSWVLSPSPPSSPSSPSTEFHGHRPEP